KTAFSFPNKEPTAMAATIITDAAQLRLLQLASPCLPVGAYAFSQGLEAAVELRWIATARDVHNWLALQLTHGLAHVDLPLLLRLHEALSRNDAAAIENWNTTLLACRESAELRLGDCAAGAALARLLPELGIAVPQLAEPTFLTLYTLAAVNWQIPAHAAALGYAWTWLENQVIAATKLLPLGQTQAQVLLSELQREIPGALAAAELLEDWQLGSSLPGLALAGIHHETQYTRLFRS
ncbi:MAG: urease accessory protein UreF, partial [Burkholderiales bacterium]